MAAHCTLFELKREETHRDLQDDSRVVVVITSGGFFLPFASL